MLFLQHCRTWQYVWSTIDHLVKIVGEKEKLHTQMNVCFTYINYSLIFLGPTWLYLSLRAHPLGQAWIYSLQVCYRFLHTDPECNILPCSSSVWMSVPIWRMLSSQHTWTLSEAKWREQQQSWLWTRGTAYRYHLEGLSRIQKGCLKINITSRQIKLWWANVHCVSPAVNPNQMVSTLEPWCRRLLGCKKLLIGKEWIFILEPRTGKLPWGSLWGIHGVVKRSFSAGGAIGKFPD
jgi:hypothetical protein